MLWSSRCAIRMGVVTGIALIGFAFPSSALGERRARGERERDRERTAVERSESRASPERGERTRAEVQRPARQREARLGKQIERLGDLVRAVPRREVRDRGQGRERTAVPEYERGRAVYDQTRARGFLAPRPREVRQRDVNGTERGAYRLYTPDRETREERPNRVFRTDPADRRDVTADRSSERNRSDAPLWRATRSRDRERDGEEQGRLERERTREPVREPQLAGGDRRHQVPRATFRGPEAEREVRTIDQSAQQRVRERLRERLRDENRGAQRLMPGTVARDRVGNSVSADVSIIVRDSISRISIGYHRIVHDFGEPSYHYLVLPRSRADYWDGYWDGYVDGYWAGRHHHHRPPVLVSFYYGYYWSDPNWFAFHYPGYYPAVYHYWGWTPRWVYPARVYCAPVQHVEYVYVPVTPYRYYTSSYAVDEAAAARAVEDVRRAWFDSEIRTLAYHLTDQVDIRVYFEGEYEYSTSADDYYAMTVDVLATTHTVAMDFDEPIWLSTHEFFVTGRHVFYDPAGDRQVVYVSYRFRKLGGEWYIVAVGSSLEPIRHKYHDFRF